MDIIFDCPFCETELAVDSAGQGSEIQCPACSETIIIPLQPGVKIEEAMDGKAEAPAAPPPAKPKEEINPMATSAGAKEHKSFAVPQHKEPTQSLIVKPNVPLEAAAKVTDRQLRIRTIRHHDCVEVGHDKFDDRVTQTIEKIGEQHLVSITPVTYSHVDVGSRQILQDYGVIILYHG